MEVLDYILQQCKNAHYHGWMPETIEQCKSAMADLSHDDLFRLRTSKWFRTAPKQHPLYNRLIELLHKDRYDILFEKYRNAPTTELFCIYSGLQSGICKKQIQEIFSARYENMTEEEKDLIKPLLDSCK